MAQLTSLLSSGKNRWNSQKTPQTDTSQANTGTPATPGDAPATPGGTAMPDLPDSVDTQDVGTPDSNYGGIDGDASLLLELEAASRAPRFGDAAEMLSPIAQNDLGGDMTAGLNTSGTSDATGATPTLLGGQGTGASNRDTASTFLPRAPPPRNTQSPETHELQQELRSNASTYVHNTSSAFSTFSGTKVDTVNEDGDSEDDMVAPTNLDTMLSNTSNDVDLINN